MDLFIIFLVFGHTPEFGHGEGEQTVFIHAAHRAAGRFSGTFEEVVLGTVEGLAVSTKAGKVAFDHEGHEPERGAADVNRAGVGGPGAILVLGLEEVLQTAFDGFVSSFGEFGRTVFFLGLNLFSFLRGDRESQAECQKKAGEFL